MATRQQIPAHGATFADRCGDVVANIERVIQGKPEVIELVLLCLISEGHLLIEDVPGVGKTSMAKALAASIDGTFGRLQFTPDLLPTDVVGLTVWNRVTSEFEFRPGPVFSNILLADEINRASPKTQSSLLEAMEERQVTVDGKTYKLEEPFMVIATQNPIEHEGTYPLPESQLDRFMIRLSIGYPGRASELEILDKHGEIEPLETLEAVADAEQVRQLVRLARNVHVADSLKSYIVDLTETTRTHPDVYLGASPRASLYLLKASRSLAASRGRDYVVPDDIKDLVNPVLAHRILLSPEAHMRGARAEDVLDALMDRVPVHVREQA